MKFPPQTKSFYITPLWGKCPRITGWQNRRYTFDLLRYPERFFCFIDGVRVPWDGVNYGILCGFEYQEGARLGVLDDDFKHPDTFAKYKGRKPLIELFEKNFAPTLQVRSHKYIFISGWDGQTIKFFDSEGVHLGELLGLGSQVVGAGSIHPQTNEPYSVTLDCPIITISFSDFRRVFAPYIREKQLPNNVFLPTSSYSGADIRSLPLSRIISPSNFSFNGLGVHPVHGSSTGHNFKVDFEKNVWYCHRCQTGGSSPELIAVKEGILRCDEVRSGCLRGDVGRAVIRVAREKYGLQK